jgi:hypothetical protein
VHEAALACGKLTRVWHWRSAYPSEVIMSRLLPSMPPAWSLSSEGQSGKERP